MKKIVYAILLTMLALVLIAATLPATERFDSGWVWVAAGSDISVFHGMGNPPLEVDVLVRYAMEDSLVTDGADLPWRPIYEIPTVHIDSVNQESVDVRNTGITPILIRVLAQP